jgi:hypothetical protein
MLSLRRSLSISSPFKEQPFPPSFSSLTSNVLVLFRLEIFSEAIDDQDLVVAGDDGPLGPGDFRPGLPPAIVACSCIHKLCICNALFVFFDKRLTQPLLQHDLYIEENTDTLKEEQTDQFEA